MLRIFKRFFSPKEKAWPFDQPKDCAVFTTTHVLKQGRDIVYVFHDEDDHGWQFHYEGEKNVSDSMVVALKEIVAWDPSVLEIADLPPGWKAWREKRGAPWKRVRNESADASTTSCASDKPFGDVSLIEQREAHYTRFLGPLTEKVMHSTDVKSVHVDIYTFPPTEARPFYVLVTGGMSDVRQAIPPDWRIAPRAEIMMYAGQPQGWMYNVLKGLAEMPSDDGTFLSHRHTVPNGKPMTARPSVLTSYFFVHPMLMPEGFSPMKVAGDDTDILLLIPITEEERRFAKERGAAALISLFGDRGLDPVVDENRRSFVSPEDFA